MAAILQFRQGSKASFISSGPFISEPFFDTDTNIIHIGVSGSSTITLTKLEDINSGSFSVSGDISGSNLYLTGDITASNTLLSGDITIGGNIILGDQVQDNITVSGQFDSDLIPSASATYNLGSPTKKWNHLYALSASIDSIDLVSNLPSGVISGSQQVIDSLPSGVISGSQQVIDSLPSGIVSSSNQIDTGSIHFQQGVELYSINGITPLSGLYGSANGLGVQIRGLSADGLSFDGPGNLIIDTGSDYFVSGAQEASLLGLPQGTVSSSQQVVDFLPTNTVSGSVQVLGGTNIVSSSVQVISFLPSGTISGSTQITNGSTILSSSIQTNGFDSYTTDVNNRLTPLETSTNALNAVSHSHANKANLDTINQNLSTTSQVQFLSLQSGQTEISSNLVVAGTGSFANNVTIYGDLRVFGTESIVNSENLSIADNMIYLNSGSTITNPDLGWVGNYNDGTYAHAGIFRDASDGVFKFYDEYTPEPEGSIDTTHASFNLANIAFGAAEATLIQAENFIGTGSQLVFPGTDIVSSSQQVIDFLPNGTVSGSTQITDGSGIVSSSNQIDTGSIHFQEGVALYSINGVTPLSGLYGSANGLGVQIRGLSADGLSFDGPGNLIIDTGSDYFISGAQEASLLGLPQGTVSGSTQITNGSGIVSSSQQVIDFLPNGTISGSTQITDSSGLLSSSNENFSDFSQSVDLRLLDTLDSGSATSQSLHVLVGNFPTSGSLGTSAFYNVSSSLYDDADSVPTVKAVFDYINNTIGAADITGVSASLGLSGGGASGYVSLSLDTTSQHFINGVQSAQSYYGGWQAAATNGSPEYIYSGDTLYFRGNGVTGDIITSVTQLLGVNYIEFQLNTGSAHFTNAVAAVGAPQGTISSSAQITDLGFLVTSSDLYNDTNNLAIGTNTPTNLGATQFTINDSNTAGTSGLISFTDSDVVKSYDYVNSNYRYVDTNTGVGIVLKPDADSAKSWVFDTDGDLVSNGGDWASGNIYANNLIASSSVTASNMLVDNDIIANNFIGNIQATNGVVSSSQQITDFGFISESNSLYIDADDFSFGGTPQNVFGLNQITLRDDNVGYSGLLAFQDNTTVQSFDYVASPYRYIDTNTGIGIVLKPDSDGNKSWVIDTDGDLVSNGGSWASGNAYMNNLIASSSVTASYILVDEDITANNFIGNIQATNGVISGSSQLTSSFVDLSSVQTIGGTKTFNDIVVNGTGSFAYIESVAGSAKIIGDAFIILNNDTPTERYAGISVYDSGSANTTSSFQFDGSTNDWFYEYSDDGGVTTDHGVVMFGPEYSGKGSPTYNTNNTILKSNGGHHTLDSNITDTGTLITLGSDTTVNGVLSATTFDSLVSQSLLNDLTNDEVNQLKNIDSVTISNTQWGYLGASDQGIATTDDVTFNTLSATGDIVAYASSDRRLKDEIQPISNPIEKISQIGGYSFIWNTEKQHIYKGKDYGVIAQEIEEVLPELVDTRENGYKAVKYDRLVSLLIEGIKELSEEVKELKEKINNRE